MNRMSIAGHPIHPMLVPIPIGLWIFSLVCDLVYAANGDAQWQTTAFFTLGGGIVGALLAAIPGLVDLLTLHEGAERRTGVLHMVLNLAIVAIQAVNFWLRTTDGYNHNVVLVLSIVAVGALVVSGWLGGHLVHVLGVTQPHHESAGTASSSSHLHPRS
jgi:uncharacterized membrane protein